MSETFHETFFENSVKLNNWYIFAIQNVTHSTLGIKGLTIVSSATAQGKFNGVTRKCHESSLKWEPCSLWIINKKTFPIRLSVIIVSQRPEGHEINSYMINLANLEHSVYRD